MLADEAFSADASGGFFLAPGLLALVDAGAPYLRAADLGRSRDDPTDGRPR